jgi:hypothetical protein
MHLVKCPENNMEKIMSDKAFGWSLFVLSIIGAFIIIPTL